MKKRHGKLQHRWWFASLIMIYINSEFRFAHHLIICMLCADGDDYVVMTAAARARRRRESRQRPIGVQVSSREHSHWLCECINRNSAQSILTRCMNISIGVQVGAFSLALWMYHIFISLVLVWQWLFVEIVFLVVHFVVHFWYFIIFQLHLLTFNLLIFWKCVFSLAIYHWKWVKC